MQECCPSLCLNSVACAAQVEDGRPAPEPQEEPGVSPLHQGGRQSAPASYGQQASSQAGLTRQLMEDTQQVCGRSVISPERRCSPSCDRIFQGCPVALSQRQLVFPDSRSTVHRQDCGVVFEAEACAHGAKGTRCSSIAQLVDSIRLTAWPADHSKVLKRPQLFAVAPGSGIWAV